VSEHKPVRRGREMIDLLSYEQAIEQLFKRMRSSRACLTKISGVVVDAGEMSRFQLLSDAQWSLIADLLPARTGKQGRPFRDARQAVEGIIYRYRCGIA